MTRLSHRVWFGSTVIVVLALGAVPGVATGAPAAPLASTCSQKPYAYAGLVSSVPATGVQAVVTTVAAAAVTSGHVAGWIGVGSPKAGPGEKAEWLQVGVNTQAGIGSELYAEITLPGRAPKYMALASGIKTGSSYDLAVVEPTGRPDVWQVLVNGKAATGRITLPGSSTFQPMAMGESWNGGTTRCNSFDYRFDQLRISANGSWGALKSSGVVSSLGYKVVDRTEDGFTAISG